MYIHNNNSFGTVDIDNLDIAKIWMLRSGV